MNGEAMMMSVGINVPYLPLIFSMASMAVILLLFISRRGVAEKGGYRRNFLTGRFKALLLSRRARFVLQAPFVFLFVMVIVAGIWGIQISGRNIATVLTWNIWWIGLIFAIILAGKVWCFVCPWQAVADWLKYLTFWRRNRPVLCLNKKWPSRWKNIYLAAGMFVGLTWLELGYGITSIPMATAYFALLMLGITIVPNLVFEKGAFCRYGCLVGRISGLYAMFAPIELRAGDKDICIRDCAGKDCFTGNERGYPCPTSLYLGDMDLNTYCILCGECIKSCPNDNVSINLRPFAHDLVKPAETRIDESYLTIIMMCLTYFHALTMIPLWEVLTEGLRAATGFPYLAAFSIEMALILAIPAIVFFLVTKLSGKWARDPSVPARTIFINFAYSLLPLTLFFHLAHNTAHLFREGGRMVVVVSDPMGLGWNLFGTAGSGYSSMLGGMTLFNIQVMLIYLGFGFSVYVAYRVGMKTFGEKGPALRSLAPVALFLLGLAILGIWMLSQPMVHRTGM